MYMVYLITTRKEPGILGDFFFFGLDPKITAGEQPSGGCYFSCFGRLLFRWLLGGTEPSPGGPLHQVEPNIFFHGWKAKPMTD